MLVLETSFSGIDQRECNKIVQEILRDAGWIMLGVSGPAVDAHSPPPPQKIARWGTQWREARAQEIAIATLTISYTTSTGHTVPGPKRARTADNAVRVRLTIGDPKIYNATFVDFHRLHLKSLEATPINIDGNISDGLAALHFPSLVEIRVRGPITTEPPAPMPTERALRQRNPSEPAEDEASLREYHSAVFNVNLPDKMKFVRVIWSAHPIFQFSFVPTCIALSRFVEVERTEASRRSNVLAVLYQDLVKARSDAAWSIVSSICIDNAVALSLNPDINPKSIFSTASKQIETNKGPSTNDLAFLHNAGALAELQLRSIDWPAGAYSFGVVASVITEQRQSSTNSASSGMMSVIEPPPSAKGPLSLGKQPLKTGVGSSSSGVAQQRQQRATLPATVRAAPSVAAASAPSIQKEPPALISLSVKELRDRLRDRGLKTTGTKQELLDRLRAAV